MIDIYIFIASFPLYCIFSSLSYICSRLPPLHPQQRFASSELEGKLFSMALKAASTEDNICMSYRFGQSQTPKG